MEDRFIYRYWDLQEKEMVYNTIEHALLCLDLPANGNKLLRLDANIRFLPMLCTGFKGKNGKLFFGGDLIEIVYGDTPNGFECYGREPKYEKVVGEIELKNGNWVIKHTSPNTGKVVYGDLYRVNKDNPKEIIGNKFCNPELLENK